MYRKDVAQEIVSTTCRLGSYIDLDLNQYKIPFNQRIYEWKKSETERLWNDFIHVSSVDGAQHMLNFITLVQEDEDSDCYIFDGQQRTITCVLIFSAIARKINEIKNNLNDDDFESKEYTKLKDKYSEKEKKIIENRIELNDELNDKNRKIIEFYNSEDTDFFYNMITNYSSETDLKEQKNRLNSESTQRNLMSNYINIINFLDSYIDMETKELDDKEKEYNALINLYKNIYNKVLLITMKVKNEKMALQMFESLNNTGRDLEKYFVLKNEIYRNSLIIDNNSKGDYTQESTSEHPVKKIIEEKWETIDFNLEGINKGKFLKDVSTVLNGNSTKANAYTKIISKYNMEDKTQIDNLLDMLLENSEKYRLIVHPEDIKTFDNEDYLKEYILYSNCLSTFGFNQYYPVLLSAMLNEYKDCEMLVLIKHIFSISVRNIYFGDSNPNSLEKLFARISKGINDKSINFDDAIEQIKGETKSNDVVFKQINEFSTTSNYKPRALFNLIYYKCQSNKLKEIKTSIDNSKVDLEHIFPKNPKDEEDWKKYFKDDKERIKYTGKLGNMTLWYSKVNQFKKNVPFSDKVSSYADSEIFFTRMLANNSEWGKKEIDRRTKKIAKALIKIL